MDASDIQILPDRSVAGTFLHGVALDNAILVHNLGIVGKIWSVDYMGAVDPGLAETYRSVREIPLNDIIIDGLYGNILSPRAAKYFILAALFESGKKIVNGYDEPLNFSEGARTRTIEIRDIELAFEERRRKLAPDAPSRLSCIWLAEDSDVGRGVIRSMLPRAYITNVHVPFCTRLAVADAAWFDEYLNFRKAEYIENYWTGVLHQKHSSVEIMVDGVVQLSDAVQLEHIKTFGKRL